VHQRVDQGERVAGSRMSAGDDQRVARVGVRCRPICLDPQREHAPGLAEHDVHQALHQVVVHALPVRRADEAAEARRDPPAEEDHEQHALGGHPDDREPEDAEEPPPARQAWASFGWLLASLVTVVGLAKMLSPTIEWAVETANAPRAVVGIVIAALVLLPETWAAVRAARANRLQSSMNLAVGSALASIGLTVPVVVLAGIAFDMPLVLGLAPKDMAMLVVTFLVSTVTLGTGRTYVMQGAVHLVLFAAYLFLAFVP